MNALVAAPVDKYKLVLARDSRSSYDNKVHYRSSIGYTHNSKGAHETT